MIKQIILIFSCFCFFQSDAQNCSITKNCFNYTQVDILAPRHYPLMLSGISKELTSTYSNTDFESFIRDFYSKNFYSGIFSHSYYQALDICMTSKGAQDYLKKSDNASRYSNKMFSISSQTTFRLLTGETIILKTSKIEGSFFVFPSGLSDFISGEEQKQFKNMPLNDTVIVPFEIIKINKVKRK